MLDFWSHMNMTVFERYIARHARAIIHGADARPMEGTWQGFGARSSQSMPCN